MDEHLSKHERRMQKHQGSPSENESPRSGKKMLAKPIIFLLVILIIGAAAFYAINVNANKSHPYDAFAKCLSDKGTVMYGASWCQYTDVQKKLFDRSFKHVNYHDFSENPDVKITPTWYYDGKKYEGVQDFYKLREITGCNWETA